MNSRNVNRCGTHTCKNVCSVFKIKKRYLHPELEH